MREVQRLLVDASEEERVDKINEIVDAVREIQQHISQGL